MPTLAAYPGMMQRVCRAAWLVEVSVREYRQIQAGERFPDSGTYERICSLYGFPQTPERCSHDYRR